MKTAIIGLGAMGRRHLAAVASFPSLQLVAVCDSQPVALEFAGLSAGVARFTDSAGLFREARPELVIIATTAPSHQRLVEDAVRAGARAILCEKPIACSLSAARRMISLCAEHDVRLAVNHCRRHVPAYRWLRTRICSGDWGQLRAIRIASPGIGLGCLATHFVSSPRGRWIGCHREIGCGGAG